MGNGDGLGGHEVVLGTTETGDIAVLGVASEAAAGEEDVSKQHPVAIGENMEERVQPYADSIGADTYQRDPSGPPDAWEQNQRDWIDKQMDDGRETHDVGPDPARENYPEITSKWYKIERDAIDERGYPTIPVDPDRP